MAKSSKQVLGFLEDLARRCRPAARREFSDLEEFAGRTLEAWDLAYVSERLQESRFKVSQEALRPYFPLPKVLSGLFAVTERLYGIGVRERPGVSVWHAERALLRSIDSSGRIVAGFYLDPYSRVEKRSGAWMDECVVAKSLPSGKAVPVAQLVCNFTTPVGSSPSLLTHDEVTTLFHEFGHGLHHMLTQVAYPSIAGINGVAWDAVELPSQFMENFVWRAEVLPLISAHVKTGAPLPADVLQRLLGTRTFNAALDTLRQIELASFDFELHAYFDAAAGARVAETLERGPAAGGGRAGGAVQSHARELRPYLRGRLRGRLLQLQVGGGARGRRVRGVRGSRHIRSCDRGPLRRFHTGARREPGCDGRLRALSRPAAGRAPPAQANRHRRVKWRSVQWLAAAAMLLTAVSGRAATAYVTRRAHSQRLSDQNQQGQRLATLHSGASVETLSTSADYTEVRLGDGVTGWVKRAS